MTSRGVSLRDVGDVLRSADLLDEVLGPEDVAVLGVCQDSRAVAAGDLFLAWKGTDADAHDYVADAVVGGAVATVVERPVDVSVPQLVVRDGRRAAALASGAVMRLAHLDLLTIGVTGTNGKTTTALITRHLLAPDFHTAVIGTLGVVDDAGVREGTEGLTTPGPVQVAVWIRDLADEGMGAVVLEASSHALEQHRLDGLAFDIAIFTNLSQDHLDYHPDMAAYRAAKLRLVDLVSSTGTIVVNDDDPAWSGLASGDRRVTTYGIDTPADIVASHVASGPAGTGFRLSIDGRTHDVHVPLVGRYNVSNALAAIAAARSAGVPVASILSRLETVPHVSGRLEAVLTEPFSVLIDFAHTPDALSGALSAVKAITRGRLIVVFGAGGDRDRTKRRPMAEAVAAIADVVVLTSDNPRTEDPDAIIDDLEAGLEGVERMRFVDRRVAIRAALEAARPGDTVVLAGKGHETYQVVGVEKRPFDEREIVRSVITDLGVV